MKKEKGFSLIEVMVGLVILGVVGGLITGILSRTYKGSNKTSLIGNIQQNGQSALNILDSNIRNADLVICPTNTTPATSLVIQNKQGAYLRFRFVPQVTGTNGYIEQEALTLGDPSQASTLCTTASTPSAVSLTDRNTTTGISLVSGFFQVNKTRGVKDVVTIYFDVAPGVSSGSGYDSTLGGSINFRTSIQLR